MKLNSKKLSDRYEALAKKLRAETFQRKTLEKKLKKSERYHKRLLEEGRDMQEHLRHLSRKILLAQEDERKEISRELHDEIGQTLAGINVNLAALKAESEINTKDLKKKIIRTQQLVEKSVKIVHRFARELRPAILDDLGLIPALHSQMKEFTKRTGIHIQFKASASVEKLSFVKRTIFYRVMQEALSNIAKHARAGVVKVTLEKINKTISIQVKDNGKSFDVKKVLLAKKFNRLGLLGMRERVEMAGGKFTVHSIKGTGTTIGAEVPL